MNDIDCKILISRIEELANERGLNLTTVFVESGAGKNFKSNLRIAKPSLGKITLIANYLDTTPEYLIGETDEKRKTAGKPDGISNDEINALDDALDGLTAEELQQVRKYAEFLKQQRN